MGNDQTVKPVNFRDVAERIMSTVPLFVMQDDNTFYIYKNGVYESGSAEPFLNRAIRSTADDMNIERGFTPAPVNKKFIAEVFDYIRVHKVIARGLVGSNERILNLKNGLLNLDTMEFADHDSGYYSIIQYPVNYDPSATCPVIDKFISETVQPGDIETLVEYTGYSLVPGNSFKVLAMLYGGRDAGKSTYCNLVEALFGKQYTAHVPPQTIQENKFAASQLYGKVLNIVPDIGDKPLSGTETIKTLLGNDEITADQKFKSGIHFVNKSHIFWGANKTPDIKNDDLDFYDKVLMVNFPHRFDESNADRSLLDRMTSDTELSGFLNRLIAARKSLLDRGKFMKTETCNGCTSSRDRYRMESNPVEFFLERYTIASTGDISKPILHRYYAMWCESHGIKPLPDNLFGKRLKLLGREDAQIWNGESRTRVWLGIAYREPSPDPMATDCDGAVPHAAKLHEHREEGEGEGYIENDNSHRLSHAVTCSEQDKTLSVTCSQVNSSINEVKKNNIVYRGGVVNACDTCVTCADHDSEQSEPVLPVTAHDFHGIKFDLIHFVKQNHPGLFVEDLAKLADDFCTAYPVYGANPGPAVVAEYAEILKERGWRS